MTPKEVEHRVRDEIFAVIRAQEAAKEAAEARLAGKAVPKFINKTDKCLIAFRPNGRKCYNESAVRLALAG